MNSTPDQYYETYDYYEYIDTLPDESHDYTCREAACVITAILNVIIFLLGIMGNGAVIWIAGFKMKKSVNTTWYLSLALSDFIFCTTLPFMIVRIVKDDWIFGLFMCRFTSFAMSINMYSSIFILVIMSVDRCITVKFPVWAQNYRTIRKASAVVSLAWMVSLLLSTPSALFRNIQKHLTSTKCITEYKLEHSHITVVLIRFIFGFLIPFLIICFCYSILFFKLKANQMSRSAKPYKIMTLLITTFFLCWVPYQTVSLIELDISKRGPKLDTAQHVTGILASFNSCLKPFLYAFMAKDLKKCYSFMSKIESAIDEETRSAFRGTSITYSGEHRLATSLTWNIFSESCQHNMT